MERKVTRRFLIALPIAVAGAFVVFLLLYAKRMSEAIVPGMGTAHTTSLEPVELLMRDAEDNQELRLRIPKAYLTKAATWRGGSQRFIWLQTRLPALNPTPASSSPPLPDSPQYERWLAESNEGIYIFLQNDYAQLSAATMRERLLTKYSVDRNSRHTIAYESISDEAGLAGYKSLACRPLASSNTDASIDQQWGCEDTYREYYVSKDGDPIVHIICGMTSATGIWRARRECSAMTLFRGFLLKYSFRQSQLSRWQEFDSGVRKLLESFMNVESSNSAVAN